MKLVSIAALLIACKGGEAAQKQPGTGMGTDARLAPDANTKPVVVKPSTRCAECHGKMADEWSASMHAQSNRSKLYLAMSANDETCATCHAPLVAIAGADHPAAREGVTCDVCHTISAVNPDAPPPRFTLGVFDMIKYGPLCDAKDHYFHRMGCSKLHESAELCGGCHQRVVQGPDGPVPLYTTYEEWKDGPYPDEGWQCQDCHMPGVKAVVAEGEKVRANVPDHGFFGGGDLRKDAAKLELAARELDGGRVIDARLTNYAGHDLPSGFPGKRAVLRAVALDRAGKELARSEISIGRKLVDVRGAPTAYANAARVATDDRLKAKEVRAVPLFSGQAIAGAAKVKADFVWQSIDPALAGPLGAAVDEKPIAHAEMKIR